MRYLIKNARIVSPDKISQKKDILIVQGKIVKIGKKLVDAKAKIIESKNLHVSIGFCDIGTHIGEPGFEERETIQSISKAAASGGYTTLAPFPNLNPIVDNKSVLRFIRQEFENTVIEAQPIGAISKKCEGKDIAEMLDMHQQGAVAFSDGNHSVQDTGLTLRALQYTKTINKTVIQHPNNTVLSKGTSMHEGEVSTSLGLPGNPRESEIIMAKRDIDLAKYADAPLCLHNISTAELTDIIKKAKKKSNGISASVAVMNLLHTDDELKDFDPMYKVHPPIRESSDRRKLLKAVNNDVVDFISSNHRPMDPENKDLEFFRSAYGASTIETTFSSLLAFAGDTLSLSKIIEKLAYGPRRILDLVIPSIQEGEIANLCIFDPVSERKVNLSNLYSKSKNNPYIGQKLKGNVIAVFNKHQVFIN